MLPHAIHYLIPCVYLTSYVYVTIILKQPHYIYL